MNIKITTGLAALFMSVALPTFAQDAECPPGVQSCNITQLGDREYDNSQTVGDTIDNTYAPDSANASSSIGDVDVDAVAQGGAAYATGNTSSNTNNNQSSANNSATNNMSNGNISNDVTGGNLNQGQGQSQTITTVQDTRMGDVHGPQVGSATGHTMGDQTTTTTSGPASTVSGAASTVGGRATTNSGSVRATGGSGGKATATGGQGGRVANSGNSRSASSSNSGGNVVRGGNTNVDASQRTTIKHAASMAAPIHMPGYGVQNCFGDTNPSGSFGASIQTFGWGATANSQKASNVCALVQLMGPKAAVAYLAQMDPNVGKALVNNGLAVSVEQVRAAETSRHKPAATMACPVGFTLFDRGDKMVCRQGAAPVASHHAPPAGMSCPATHPVFVPGKGCRR